MRCLTVICALLTCLLGGAVAAEMSHEETVVRTAYAKLSYVAQQGAIGQMAMESFPGTPANPQYTDMTTAQRLADAQLKISLTDFVIGDIRDILNRKAVDFITQPVGEKLIGGIATNNYSLSYPGKADFQTHWHSFNPSWQLLSEYESESEHVAAVASITFADLYRLQWLKDQPEATWQRYISYSVTVSYRGRTVGPYKAMFIFGHDASGNEVIQPQDANIDPGWLVTALHEPLFPDALVFTGLRDHPVVANRLKTTQMSRPACSVGQGDVCCDLIQMKCGPGRADLAAGLAKPLPGPPARMSVKP